MSLLLNWRVWVALALAGALAFSHFSVYRAGKNNVTKEWKASVAAANLESSRFERARQRGVDEAQIAQSKRNAGLAADARAARLSVDSLLATLDATERMAAQSHGAATRATAALRTVFESCTRANLDLAAAAQGHANDSLMYQESWPK